ncbi:SH3 domain-containing protein [Phycomyces blakesleeanus]|uniref:SH3 domain-containing protein n=1 Tax=Phycomyces blakesleeanus TaxID=4837 RepID=A0ABR3BHA4_PHYBL
MSEREQALAAHVLESIQKELLLLKGQKYLTQKAYDEIFALLPTNLSIKSTQNPTQNHGYGYPPSPQANKPSASPSHQHQQQPPPPAYGALASNSLSTAEALYDFPGTNPRELPLRQGEIVQVTEHVDNDWWRGSLHGRTGVFPRTYVKPVESGRPSPPSPPTKNNNSHGGGNYPSPPPRNNAPPPHQQPPSMPAPGASYPAPPEASAPAQTAESSEGRISGFAKKFGGNVANAATWGFGATCKLK